MTKMVVSVSIENVKRGIILSDCVELDQVRRQKEPWKKGTANKGTINVVDGEGSNGSNSSDGHSGESLYVIHDANPGPSKRKKLYVSIKMHTDNDLPAREVTCQNRYWVDLQRNWI